MKRLAASCPISVIIVCLTLSSVAVLAFAQGPTSGPGQGLQSCSDDFSIDSGLWQYLGSAYRDQTNQYIVLTESTWDQGGVALFKFPFKSSFTASFSYKAGKGYGGDGLSIFFYKQNYSNIGRGGSEGFQGDNVAVPGYGIEFDGWQNIREDFETIVGGQISPGADPSDGHIALIKDSVGNHLAYVNDPRVKDNSWHNVKVAVDIAAGSVNVFVDQGLVLQWNGSLDRTYGGFGFSGGTGGGGTNEHLIDNVSLSFHGMQLPQLSLLCSSSSAYSGFNVEIQGSLAFNDTAIANAPIFLAYSVNGGKSWSDLTLLYTIADGSYSATWLPSVTGNYLVKASYGGDADNLAVSEAVNFAVMQFAQKNVFSVSSNSSVTALAFNSSNSAISFTVSGPSGTIGYVKATIAKSLISNPENIRVYLDSKQLNYEVTSLGDSWLLSFTYSHSTHHVSIDLAAAAGGPAFLGLQGWTWIVVAVVIVAMGVVSLVYFKKRKREVQ